MRNKFCVIALAACLFSVRATAQVDTTKVREMNAILREDNFDKKAALFNAYLQKWNGKADGDNGKMLDRMYGAMTRAAIRANNIKAFDTYIAHSATPDASLNFEFAQKLVKENLYTADAKRYAAVAYVSAKKDIEKTESPAGLPDSVYQQIASRQNFILAKYADVYAQACYQSGDYTTGLPVAKEAAVTAGKSMDWSYNEHYALLLAKAAPADEAKAELERLMRMGMLNENGQAALKEVYVKKFNTDKGFDTYLQQMKTVADARLMAKLKQQWLSEKAPAASFSQLYKGDISIAQLKGKVVVLDFWATWCIPCVSSFPAMQKVVNKYKNDPNVVFLFVDTKEQLQDIEAVRAKTQKFLAKDSFKNYTFSFVLDDGEKNAEAYGVKMIPAKYVIDADGIIRFKATGFSGKDDDLVAELGLMIEMAKKKSK